MFKKKIEAIEMNTEIFRLWKKQWLLLTSGSYERSDFNSMTVAWGSMGVMWNKIFVQIVVRPTRYTDEFLKKYDSFTLTAFPDKYREKLKYLGTVSGRDEDKIKVSELTPVSSKTVSSPGFEESELTLECRKIYTSRFLSEEFIDPEIENCYSANDYHNIYFGEVLYVEGTEKFIKN
ncbi:MAG: flavin reductase [Candidatus Delongbacteria bacterium]